MRLLPLWVATAKLPAFYDVESTTAIQQTAKLYGAMQEMITELNKYMEEVSATLTENEEEQKQIMKCFQQKIVEIVENFIKCVDTKIDKQNLKIEEQSTKLREEIYELIGEGNITVTTVYDEDTESLILALKEEDTNG